MAVDMFMKLNATTGKVDGESTDEAYASHIDVLSWSWGMTQSGTTHTGTGSGAGKVNVHDLTFTKYIDKSSPIVLKLCASGTHLTDATLIVRKAGPKPVEYVTIVMTDCLVTSVSHGGSGGDDRLTENVTLNFGKVSFTYLPQDAKGDAGSAVDMGWNIAANVAS